MATPDIIPASVTTGSGPTLLRLRNRLADELGLYQAVTTTATASGGDPSRVLIADELRDDEAGFAFLGEPFVYVRSGVQAGVQRRLVSEPGVGHQGSMAALVVSRPFAATVLSGSVLEITSPLPVVRYVGRKGLNDLVNEGLSLIRVPARLTFTGNGTYSYDLAAYPWLTSIDQTRGIYDTQWQGTPTVPLLSPWPYRIVSNGVTRTLVTEQAYTTADTFYLDVVLPADRLVYDGSSWSYVVTPGLQGDAWQAACPEEWIVPFGMVVGLREVEKLIRARRDMDPQERVQALALTQRDRARWARSAVWIRTHQFPKPVQEPSTPMICPPNELAWN